LVLAILCDFKGQPPSEVVHFIFERLQQLAGNNESGLREYIRMVEILSVNRSLEKVVEEEEKMLSQIKTSQLPSFNIGLKQGLIEGKLEGKLEGEVTVLCRLMTRRFGPISEATQARLDNATLEQLEQWTDNILEAATLDDVFKEN
jgi:predicted transposase YdaD